LIVRPSLLKPEKVVVADEGDLVSITVGNSTLRMAYADALRFSQMVRVHAKRAKKRAGDVSRHWSAVADLEGLVE
jgi:hypothetical protein